MKIASRYHGRMLIGMTLVFSVGMIVACSQPVSAQSPLTITTASLHAGNVGSTYSSDLSASGGTPPYRWAVTKGSLPPGLTLSGATIGGTPTAAGTSDFTVQVTDSGQPAQTKQIALSLVIGPALLVITRTSLPTAMVGAPYSQTLSASGGTAPYSWSIASGSLPPGLTLSGATITGTPSAPGSSNFHCARCR